MKKLLILALLLTATFFYSLEAKVIEKDIPNFTSLMVSLKINVVLIKGTQSHIKIDARYLDLNKLNVEMNGDQLEVYLDGAKLYDKTYKKENGNRYNSKISDYKDAEITAYITYTDTFEEMEIRGEQKVVCRDDISVDDFKIVAYGEQNLDFAAISADYLKINLIGEHNITIRGGEIEEQNIKAIGESIVRMNDVHFVSGKVKAVGESDFYFKNGEKVKFTSIGESTVYGGPNTKIKKGLSIGENRIRNEW